MGCCFGSYFLGEGVFFPALPMIPDVSCLLFGLSNVTSHVLGDGGDMLISKGFF